MKIHTLKHTSKFFRIKKPKPRKDIITIKILRTDSRFPYGLLYDVTQLGGVRRYIISCALWVSIVEMFDDLISARMHVAYEPDDLYGKTIKLIIINSPRRIYNIIIIITLLQSHVFQVELTHRHQFLETLIRLRNSDDLSSRRFRQIPRETFGVQEMEDRAEDLFREPRKRGRLAAPCEIAPSKLEYRRVDFELFFVGGRDRQVGEVTVFESG